ncbi:unnamed protein product [Prorocentrum cordatum]|uniref:Uncharacterized protein n=1 Tax=Prorocentrum cordatum TaxID=2364126 RepID=A0ABN9QB13_9DINO|nr:unnamed protein product [Polarella glacialis]
MMKINENEELHMNLFEVQRQREEEEQRLHESHAAVRGELEQKASDLEAERTQKSRLLTESQELARQIQYLEDQLSESQTLAGELRRSLHDQRRGAAQEARSLRTQLARWAPFDEAEHPAWSRWDSRPARGREAHRQGQASQHLQASIADACRQGCGVFQAWSRVFGSGCDEEPAARLRVRSRLADVAQQLAVAMEAAPELFAASWHPGPGGALLAGRFRQGADAILRLHRRWATYQSLLLLHDWSGGQAGRSTQEEIQAQAFVDCMWRLCRCVKSLFVKLSLLACMPTLLMRDCSSNHFDLARASLRRPRRLDGERSQPDTELLEVTPGAASSTAAPPMGDPPAERVPGLLLERLRGRARDALQCWEGIGRCLSALATQQAGALDGQGREGRAMLELLESIKRLCSLTAERVLPTADCAAAGVAAPGGLALLGPGASLRAAQAVAGRGYLRRATARLAQAPVGIGFEEALQARRAVRQLMANRPARGGGGAGLVGGADKGGGDRLGEGNVPTSNPGQPPRSPCSTLFLWGRRAVLAAAAS